MQRVICCGKPGTLILLDSVDKKRDICTWFNCIIQSMEPLNKKPQFIYLVYVYTGNVVYVTDSDKIKYYMLNTIKLDPSKLK